MLDAARLAFWLVAGVILFALVLWAASQGIYI